MELDKEAAIEFLRRSYTAADGLWFMKVEELLGTDAALDLDASVWRVMPKIQARLLKESAPSSHGIMALSTCLGTKLRWEGYLFESTLDKPTGTLTITIRQCPWHRALVKSRRQHLAERIATQICQVEYPIWAAEFDLDLHFTLVHSLCRGADACILHFGPSGPANSTP